MIEITIVNSCLVPPKQNRKFPLYLLPNGTPCIIGSADGKSICTVDSQFVFSPGGGFTKTHPLPDKNKCLYEIHVGDFVGTYEVDSKQETLLINSYYISQITTDNAIGTPAQL